MNFETKFGKCDNPYMEDNLKVTVEEDHEELVIFTSESFGCNQWSEREDSKVVTVIKNPLE
jgi:hypothetical protein